MSYPRSARLRRVARCAGFALATLCIALVGLELALRALDLRPPRLPLAVDASGSPGKHYERRVDGPLRWELVPGSVSRLRYLAHAGGDEREVAAHINRQGWRGAEVALERRAPGLRIACAGDSFTFGTGVADHETLPAQLAARLARDGVARVEVLNWGVEGYDTSQEVAQLELRLPRWRPDVVVLTYFVNDAAHPDAPVIDRLPPARRSLARLCGPDAPAALAWLREHSWGARWACLRLTSALLEGRQARMEDALYVEANPGWTLVREGLCRARDLCRAQGCELLVALYPRLGRRDGALVTDAVYARVAAFCRAEGIDVLDLSAAFADEPVERRWVHPLDPHPDARAHALAAAALARHLGALGWLAPRSAQARR